ncbi:glutathione synthetase [Ralstonia solanacearum]|nr:glutathione synthetase [Ralstonia solanacearum]
MKTLELPCPSKISAAERAAEITAILASAIVRTLAAPASTESPVGLGFVPDQRVHTTPSQQDTL